MTDVAPAVPVPHDVDLEDRLVGRLTFRHLGYLLLAAAGVAVIVTGDHLATRLLGGLLAGVGAAAAAWRPAGRPLDQWVLPLIRYHRRRPQWTPPHVEATSMRDGSSAPEAVTTEDGDPTAARPGIRLPSLPPRQVLAGAVGAALAGAGIAAALTWAPSETEPATFREADDPATPAPHHHPVPGAPPVVAPTAEGVRSADDLLFWLESLD